MSLWKKTALLRTLSLAALLAACTALPTLSCAALEEESSEVEIPTYTSGDFTYSVLVMQSDESVKAVCIEDYTGSASEVVIPEEIDGMPVVTLGERAFLNNTELEAVTIPASLQDLGKYAFAACSSLTEFRVAEGSEYYESVDGVLYAQDQTYLVRYPIGRRPEEITVPDGVADIGNSAFADCALLQKITLPKGLKAIGEGAFTGCGRLMEITIPEGVEEIEKYTFLSCESLSTVHLPESLISIGDGAFARTTLQSVDLPSKLTYIGEGAFAETGLKEITIPRSVMSIGYSAFGYNLNAEGTLTAIKDFIIYGTAGSAAQDYAEDEENGGAFLFQPVSAEETTASASDDSNGAETTTATTAAAASGIGTGRLIGVIACCAALLAIAVIFIRSLLRGKKQDKQD